MLNQFDRHQLDAVVGQDPFREDMTPKWADCDKSVTSFDDKRPDSLSKFISKTFCWLVSGIGLITVHSFDCIYLLGNESGPEILSINKQRKRQTNIRFLG